MRVKQEHYNLDFTSHNLSLIPPIDNEFFSVKILDFLRQLFKECSVETLNYISDEAKLSAIIKSSGISSFSELLEINTDNQEKRCVHCGSAQYVSYGQYVNNTERVQRYRCKKCDRVFTLMNKSIISESKLDFSTWVNFINCLYHGISISETAKLCNISEKSVHNNRLRVFYALKILNDRIKLHEKVVIDETYFPVSFKGNRSLQKDFSPKRKARKRGSDIHTPGLSEEYVCVVCAIDIFGNSVVGIAGVGAPTATRIQRVLENAFDKNEPLCIYSDKERALKKFAAMNGFQIQQSLSVTNKLKKRGSKDVEIRRQQQIINSYHSRLKKFLQPFCGMSSSLLSGYLSLFAWIDRNRHNDPIDAYKELFSIMIQPNLHKTVNEIEMLPCFLDVTNIPDFNQTRHFRDFRRACEIYAKYAKGEKTKDIAKEYNVSPGEINRITRKFRKLGFGYKTEKEKRKEELSNQIKPIPYPYKNSKRNREIYQLKKSWTGSAKSFYQMATKKYHLKKQTIKNIISIEKRIISLEEPFYICQEYKYSQLFDVYSNIYNDFLELKKSGETISSAARKVAKIYNYTEMNICRIIRIMKENPPQEQFKNKKIATIECSNRDKAIFIEFLKWEGTKKDFCIWASEQHNLGFYYIYHIISLSCYADPERYEITYQYPTQRKEPEEDY